MNLRLREIVVLLAALLCTPVVAQPVVSFEDPRFDDYGPGTYTPPTGSQFQSGDFDLRKFSVRIDKEWAVFEITLGAPVRRAVIRQRTNAGDIDLSNGIFVQNVDIYVDTTPSKGFTVGLPGRRIGFAPEEAWDVAFTLTPQPGPTRTVLSGWNREAAERIYAPMQLRSTGPTVTARVPLWQLGGTPKPSWGWSVMVSGAAWEHSFTAVQRLRGGEAANAFTLPVFSVPEEDAFGGGVLGGNHPFVIDVILPEGSSQDRVLGTFNERQYAVIPMIYRERPKAVPLTPASPSPDAGEPPDRAVAASSPSEQASDAGVMTSRPPILLPQTVPGAPATLTLEIANVQGETVVIPTSEGAAPKVWQIGTVVNAEGHQVGRVVVTNVSTGFALATLTEGKGRVVPGNRVRFTPPGAPVR